MTTSTPSACESPPRSLSPSLSLSLSHSLSLTHSLTHSLTVTVCLCDTRTHWRRPLRMHCCALRVQSSLGAIDRLSAAAAAAAAAAVDGWWRCCWLLLVLLLLLLLPLLALLLLLSLHLLSTGIAVASVNDSRALKKYLGPAVQHGGSESVCAHQVGDARQDRRAQGQTCCG